MPLPPPGQTDLQLVQSAFREIRAQGVEVERDIVKVKRLGDLSNGKLGTILVEMRNQETKAQIMKTKKCLESHPNPGLQKLIIKNAQNKSEIKMNIALNQILRKIPGEQNSYVAGNGHIMSKNDPPHSRVPYHTGRHTQGQQSHQQQFYPKYNQQTFPTYSRQTFPTYPQQTFSTHPQQTFPTYTQAFSYMPNITQAQVTSQPPMSGYNAPINPFARTDSTPLLVPVTTATHQTPDQTQPGSDSAQVAGQDSGHGLTQSSQTPLMEVGSPVTVEADVHHPSTQP